MSDLGRLPKKDADLFRSLVNCYENKHYPKGIKVADQILKKHPKHGETLAMKGLILNCMDEKEQAYALVKAGVGCDDKSHISWHVFGLLHRSDNNYKEAIECYEKAIARDPTSQTILRDLSNLQAQLRNYEGYYESRNRLLLLRSDLTTSWVAAAVGCFMTQRFGEAYDKIEDFRRQVKKRGTDPFEESELYLFQNLCYERQGKLKEALVHLAVHRSKIVDKLSLDVKAAQLSVLMGGNKFEDARTRWHALLTEQPDNYRFHTGLQTAALELDRATAQQMFALKRLELPSTVLALTSEQKTLLRELYAAGNYKTPNMPKILLTLCRDEEELRASLDAHMRKCLRSGKPALFHDICSLIRVPATRATGSSDASGDTSAAGAGGTPPKAVYVTEPVDVREHMVVKMCTELLDGYISNLRSIGRFDPTDSADADARADTDSPNSAVAGEEQQAPSALLWALFLQCHLREICGDLPGALLSIEAAIAHTPTALDIRAKRAKLLKKIGDVAMAAVVMDDCRALDLQDRYLNNKTVKYLLRSNETDLALTTISMFTKNDITEEDGGDPQQYLFGLQCNWFELELGEAHARRRQWGPALRKFYSVRNHFQEYENDMFDFHGFCLRKVTLRAYVDILSYNSTSFSHKFFQRAFRGALRVLLHLLDCPEDVDGLGHLPPAERKKERAKLKKLKKKNADSSAAGAGDKGKGAAAEPEVDEDGLLVNVPAADGTAEVEDKEKDSKKKKKKGRPGIGQEPDQEDLLRNDFGAEIQAWCEMLQPVLSMCAPATLAIYSEAMVRRSDFVSAVEGLRVGFQQGQEQGQGQGEEERHVVVVDADLIVELARATHKVKNPSKKQTGLSGAVGTQVKAALAKLLVGDYSEDPATTAAKAGTTTAAASAGLPAALDLSAFLTQQWTAAVERRSLRHMLAVLRGRLIVEGAKISDTTQQAADYVVALDGIFLDAARGVSAESVAAMLQLLTAHFPDKVASGSAPFRAAAEGRFPHAVSPDPLRTFATLRTEAALAEEREVEAGGSNSGSSSSSAAAAGASKASS